MIPLSAPIAFKPLWTTDKRYIVLKGGRGSGKSWQVVRKKCVNGYEKPIRVLFCREIQRSIKDSVHQLIKDQIHILGLDDYYDIKEREIIGTNGTAFFFEGLYRNVNKIKSLEGIDYAVVEEAENISDRSWDILTPTIRKLDSQIIIIFNPHRDDDPTYERFVTANRDDVEVIDVNYDSNPYFGEPLKSEMEFMKKHSHSKYLHIWEGQPITDYETLVYRFNHNVNCTTDTLKYNAGIECWTGWDFGVADDTVCLFFHIYPVPQSDEFPYGVRIEVFDEYVNNNKDPEHYRDVVQAKRYLIETHAADPSGVSRHNSLESWIDKLSTNPGTRRKDWHFEYSTYYAGKVQEMISNANEYLPSIRYNPHDVPIFHKMMRHWQYRTDKDGKLILPTKPNHDEFSHPGTALYYFITNRFPPRKKAKMRIIG